MHLENTHRLIIPNIQTNAKLYGSLEDAPEEVVKVANGIIKNYLMPHDVSGMTEEQRRDAIAFGMEEARYLVENYLDVEFRQLVHILEKSKFFKSYVGQRKKRK